MAHRHRLDNYLKTYRKRTALTQKDVAYLLGCQSGSKISGTSGGIGFRHWRPPLPWR